MEKDPYALLFHEEKLLRPRAYIKENAFLSMILSAIEVYHHETLGLLLGYGMGQEFVVEYAIPYQTAVKGYTYTMPPKERVLERMIDILSEWPGEVIGDYHSHTELGANKAKAIPSGTDIADMSRGKLSIIIAVNEKEREMKWRKNRNGSLSGTLGDFHIEIGGFVLYGEKRYRRVELICPAATGIKF